MSVRPTIDPACLSDAPAPSVAAVIDARPRDIGGFKVRRLLPSRAPRLVGPFIFFDHMGPAVLAPGDGLDVPPHPHIGLATVTYLFEGEIIHRDSLGSHQASVRNIPPDMLAEIRPLLALAPTGSYYNLIHQKK